MHGLRVTVLPACLHCCLPLWSPAAATWVLLCGAGELGLTRVKALLWCLHAQQLPFILLLLLLLPRLKPRSRSRGEQGPSK
jgi:hypothetical protein